MATRGIIARQISEKEVEFIYSHHDNYLESNGIILMQNYNNAKKINELFEQGKDLISLENRTFYNEPNAIKRTTFASLNNYASCLVAEFIYVFMLNGEWKFKEFKMQDKWKWSNFKSLAKAIAKIPQQDWRV